MDLSFSAVNENEKKLNSIHSQITTRIQKRTCTFG